MMDADDTTPVKESADIRVPPVLYPWQAQAWARVTQQISQQHLPHALLLKGAEGSGIESFAFLLAHVLLCAAPKNNLACGQCRDCHLLAVGSHPGLSVIKPEPNKKTGVMSKVIIIDQIRKVIDTVNQTAFKSGRKILIINPADVLHPAAANALLKSLEEPAAHTFFILVTQKPARLLATIHSRCQAIDLPLPDAAAAEKWLEAFIADVNQRKHLLAISGNNPLLVQQWQENEDLAAIVQLGNELKQLQEGRISPLQLAAAWQKTKLLDRLSWWWRWLALELKATADSRAAATLTVPAQSLLLFMQKLLQAKSQLESSANPNEQLLLESLLIDWQQLQ